jgi:hypothetical protein
MVLNATFNNISVISWRSVLQAEETGEPGETQHNSLTNFLCYSSIVAILLLLLSYRCYPIVAILLLLLSYRCYSSIVAILSLRVHRTLQYDMYN